MAKILLATPSRQQLPFCTSETWLFVQRFRVVWLEISKNKLVKLVRKESKAATKSRKHFGIDSKSDVVLFVPQLRV